MLLKDADRQADAVSGDDVLVAEAERFIATAAALIASGGAPPGPDVEDRYNDLRLALPAELDAYLRRKAAARAAIATAAPLVRRGGADVLVRINAPLSLAVPDIEAAVCPGVDGLILTKMRGPDHVRLLDELVSEREHKSGLLEGRLWFYLLVETPAALPHAEAIAAASPSRTRIATSRSFARITKRPSAAL